jgi:hypothetical protein
MAVTRFDDLIESMALDNKRQNGVRRSTSGATGASTKGPSPSTIDSVISRCRHSGRARSAPAAGSSARMPGRTGESRRRGKRCLGAMAKLTTSAACTSGTSSPRLPEATLLEHYALLTTGTGIPAILRFTEPRKFQLVK